jgi:hypothetical protein
LIRKTFFFFSGKPHSGFPGKGLRPPEPENFGFVIDKNINNNTNSNERLGARGGYFFFFSSKFF